MRTSAVAKSRMFLIILLLLSTLTMAYVAVMADEPVSPAGATVPPPPTGVPPSGTQYQPLIMHQPTDTAP